MVVVVGAVDGGVRAAGDCVGIKGQSLVEEVPVNSGSCEEVVLSIGA